MFIIPGGQFGQGYVIPIATGHIVQSSLKAQDEVSFFFKMESAWPFLSSLMIETESSLFFFNSFSAKAIRLHGLAQL